MARALPERIPRRRVNAIVANGINCDVFDACCLLENRLPHELVHDIVREYCEKRRDEAEVQQLVKARRHYQAGLRLVT